jgi:hypothetical protein
MKRIAKIKSNTRVAVKSKRIAKRKNGKYVQHHDKWIKLHMKMREANLRKDGLIRGMAEFLRKVLPDYTEERQLKTQTQYK